MDACVIGKNYGLWCQAVYISPYFRPMILDTAAVNVVVRNVLVLCGLDNVLGLVGLAFNGSFGGLSVPSAARIVHLGISALD